MPHSAHIETSRRLDGRYEATVILTETASELFRTKPAKTEKAAQKAALKWIESKTEPPRQPAPNDQPKILQLPNCCLGCELGAA